MTRTTASPPFIARLLIVGSGIMSLANSFTVPFLAVFLRRELGLDPSHRGPGNLYGLELPALPPEAERR